LVILELEKEAKGKMKRENCPFCGHRWIRKSGESLVICPKCKTEYDSKKFSRNNY